MAKVIVKIRIMPQDPEVDLESLREKITEKINSFCELDNAVKNVELNPVAFGLKALDISFAMDESRGDTESLEDDIKKMEDVASVEVTSVSRALG